jgi:hypothetical protein
MQFVVLQASAPVECSALHCSVLHWLMRGRDALLKLSLVCLIDSCASTVCLTFNHRADPDSTNPGQLLEHLLSDVASTADMRDMLGLLQDSLPSLEGGAPEGRSWSLHCCHSFLR